jgi:VWFA-related protein
VVASNALSTPQPQQPTVQSAENSQTAPPLRVTTHLVLVNVIVNDRHGNPIAGLTKEDFSVLDNRKLQEIQVFSAETNLPEQPLPATPAPDIYTNRISEHANVPASVTVILLDALNTEFADQALTRKQVLKLLEQIRPQDRIALYWLGNNLYALQDFTSDAASLRAAVLRSTPSSSREQSESNVNYLTLNSPNPSVPGRLSESQNSSREAFRSAFDQRVANQSVKNRVGLTLAALIAIANHVSDLKGRKSLVWVSGSFPFALGQEKFDLNWANDTDGQGFSAEIGRAALALTAAGVAVYPVDARGLMGNGVTAAGDYSEAPPPEFAEGDEHLPTRTVSGDLETMKVLAERTGGKAFYGSNNLSDAIQRAIDDSRVSYTLGFYPVNAKWDGSFHNIKVRVRTPGAKVRSRTGYFALPDSTNTPAKSLQAIISQTAISQLDATAIGLRVHVQPPSTPAQQFLAVDLHLDLHDIHMEQINGRWTSTLQTAFLQLSSHGEIIHAIDEVLQLTLPPAAYEQAQKDGLRNTRQIRVQPGAAQLCVVIRDPTTGKIGSLSIPLAKYLSTPSAPAN